MREEKDAGVETMEEIMTTQNRKVWQVALKALCDIYSLGWMKDVRKRDANKCFNGFADRLLFT